MAALRRRGMLQAAAGAALTALARPSIAAPAKVLKFVPQADLAMLDPVFTTSYVTRNHGYMVFDTLYGTDEAGAPQPQMLEGHVVEDDGKNWTLTLRDGLMFHDGSKVLARDAVASIERWWIRDTFGSVLRAAAAAITALDDRRLRIRLNKPFPMLPNAMAKTTSYSLFVMPERLARTEPTQQVTEMVGSGPYRYLPGQAVPGSSYAWERFDGYQPRSSGTPSVTAGPKIAKFDRIEWTVMPDPATAAAALQAGEADWWEQPPVDLLPLLRSRAGLRVANMDPAGFMGVMRLNCLQPPFDNAGVRCAVLNAIRQREFMIAAIGEDQANWRDRVGIFTPGSPMANDVGTDRFAGPRNDAAAKQALEQAGYHGERVVLLNPADNPPVSAAADVANDLLQKIGMNVDMVSTDWGTLQQRRSSMAPVGQGGWSSFITFASGLEMTTPASHQMIRTNGKHAFFGWPTSEKLEALRDTWFDAPDTASQLALCKKIQAQAWIDAPYVPLGQYLQPTAWRASLVGMLTGFPKFYNIDRAG